MIPLSLALHIGLVLFVAGLGLKRLDTGMEKKTKVLYTVWALFLLVRRNECRSYHKTSHPEPGGYRIVCIYDWVYSSKTPRRGDPWLLAMGRKRPYKQGWGRQIRSGLFALHPDRDAPSADRYFPLRGAIFDGNGSTRPMTGHTV